MLSAYKSVSSLYRLDLLKNSGWFRRTSTISKLAWTHKSAKNVTIKKTKRVPIMLVRDFKTTAGPTLKETRNHMKTNRVFFLTNRKSFSWLHKFHVCAHVATISLSRDKKIPLRSKLSSLIFCLILHPFLEITRVSEKKWNWNSFCYSHWVMVNTLSDEALTYN